MTDTDTADAAAGATELDHADDDAEAADTRADAEADAAEHDTDEADTFSRAYVTELRQESAEHRRRATAAEERAETLAGALWAERVAALNLLADPADLPYDADALDTPAEIRRQAEELLTRRPHLRTRRITARAGQGEGNGAENVSLTGIMRSRA